MCMKFYLGTLGMFCGNSTSHWAISVVATKNSLTADLICDSFSNMSEVFGMSCPCATSKSARLFTAAPTPSGGPVPCPDSQKFQLMLGKPLLSGMVERSPSYFCIG